MKSFVVFIAFCLLAPAAFASSLEQRIDSVIQKYAGQEQFGGTIAIQRQGQVIFRRSVGHAVREHKVPHKAETVYSIGSLTKQFTAAAVMTLHQEGRLNVHEPISKYLEVPASWGGITIRELLTHTSGLGNNAKFSQGEWAQFRSVEQMFERVKADYAEIPLEPKSQYAYSNAGYSVLAQLISVVVGKEYQDYMESLSQAWGLSHTAPDHETLIISNKATGYELIQGQWMREWSVNLSNFWGSGAMRSTVSDLLRWATLLRGESVFSSKTKELLFEKRVEIGPGVHYGYGWVSQVSRGRKMLWHNGSLRGFNSFMAMYDGGFDLILLANQNNVPVLEMSHEIMAQVFAE